MKIAHVFWGLSVGGIENMLADIVNIQIRQYEVHLIIINNLVDKELVQRIDSRCQLHFINRKVGSKNPLYIWKINTLIDRIHPDVIHYHAPELKRIVFKSYPSVITVHNTRLPTKYYAHKDKLVAISKAVRDDVKQRSGLDSVVIHNGVDLARIAVRDGKRKDTFRMVQIGRLFHTQKGQDLLINAIEQLVYKEGITLLHLDFIGEGESREFLEKMVSEKELTDFVSFIGNKDRTYVYEHLKEYDLFIQPSRFEGFGLTVVEAMAARVPVLVSQNEGPMEIIKEGKYGWFFKNEDSADCARMIRSIYIREPEEERLEETRLYVHCRFSIENMVDEYIKTYFAVLSE